MEGKCEVKLSLAGSGVYLQQQTQASIKKKNGNEGHTAHKDSLQKSNYAEMKPKDTKENNEFSRNQHTHTHTQYKCSSCIILDSVPIATIGD